MILPMQYPICTWFIFRHYCYILKEWCAHNHTHFTHSVVVEADNVRLYHTLENSREYHAEDPQYLELVPESAPVVEALLHAYPKYITIENLPLEEESEKVSGVFLVFGSDSTKYLSMIDRLFY